MPGCGADIRKEQRERRRIAADDRAKPMFVRYLILRGGIAVAVLIVVAFARFLLAP